MKLLYILGTARSGSTILASVLEKLPGAFSAGELRFLWDRVGEGRACGCGERVDRCPVWASILEDLRQQEMPDVAELSRWQRRELRLLRTPALLARRDPPQLGSQHPIDRYLMAMETVVGDLRAIMEASIVIDSSKRPSDGAAMRLLPGIDTYFVHIVRDPRAVAYSRLSLKPNPDRKEAGHTMPLSSAVNSAGHWASTNIAADAVRIRHGRSRSLLLRYEDFVRHPKHHVERIARMMDMPFDPGIFAADDRVELDRNHTVSGNPSRFLTGAVRLQPDERWRRELAAVPRVEVTALTWPLMLRYGYRLSRHEASEAV
jgi:hypothetical protein